MRHGRAGSERPNRRACTRACRVRAHSRASLDRSAVAEGDRRGVPAETRAYDARHAAYTLHATCMHHAATCHTQRSTITCYILHATSGARRRSHGGRTQNRTGSILGRTLARTAGRSGSRAQSRRRNGRCEPRSRRRCGRDEPHQVPMTTATLPLRREH
jgi:hypothetical protein